jgi:hypothetical protein
MAVFDVFLQAMDAAGAIVVCEVGSTAASSAKQQCLLRVASKAAAGYAHAGGTCLQEPAFQLPSSPFCSFRAPLAAMYPC